MRNRPFFLQSNLPTFPEPPPKCLKLITHRRRTPPPGAYLHQILAGIVSTLAHPAAIRRSMGDSLWLSPVAALSATGRCCHDHGARSFAHSACAPRPMSEAQERCVPAPANNRAPAGSHQSHRTTFPEPPPKCLKLITNRRRTPPPGAYLHQIVAGIVSTLAHPAAIRRSMGDSLWLSQVAALPATGRCCHDHGARSFACSGCAPRPMSEAQERCVPAPANNRAPAGSHQSHRTTFPEPPPKCPTLITHRRRTSPPGAYLHQILAGIVSTLAHPAAIRRSIGDSLWLSQVAALPATGRCCHDHGARSFACSGCAPRPMSEAQERL